MINEFSSEIIREISHLNAFFHCIDQLLALVALPFVAMGKSCFGVKCSGYTASMKPPPYKHYTEPLEV